MFVLAVYFGDSASDAALVLKTAPGPVSGRRDLLPARLAFNQRSPRPARAKSRPARAKSRPASAKERAGHYLRISNRLITSRYRCGAMRFR
jgi:hypothetical protein